MWRASFKNPERNTDALSGVGASDACRWEQVCGVPGPPTIDERIAEHLHTEADPRLDSMITFNIFDDKSIEQAARQINVPADRMREMARNMRNTNFDIPPSKKWENAK